MKNCAQLGLLLLAFVMTLHAGNSSADKVETVQLSQVFKNLGAYNSPGGQCPIYLTTSEKGGFTQLQFQSKSSGKKLVNDVTGVAYISNEILVYTTSPIYGTPGIFIYDCLSENTKQIVGPTKIDKAYPQGSGYFELYGIKREKIYFYYSPDVDQIDFNSFRNGDFLFEVLVNGSAFKKVSTP